MNWLKKIGRVALFAVAFFGLIGVANAQAPAQANASATLSWSNAETLTASISTPALVFTPVAGVPTTSSFSTTATWNLGGTETKVFEEFYLGSATAALSSGANLIPSSDVFLGQGGAPAPCTNNAQAGGNTVGIPAGAECQNWLTALTAGNKNSSHTMSNWVLTLQNVATANAGTYSGVFNYSVSVM